MMVMNVHSYIVVVIDISSLHQTRTDKVASFRTQAGFSKAFEMPKIIRPVGVRYIQLLAYVRQDEDHVRVGGTLSVRAHLSAQILFLLIPIDIITSRRRPTRHRAAVCSLASSVSWPIRPRIHQSKSMLFFLPASIFCHLLVFARARPR